MDMVTTGGWTPHGTAAEALLQKLTPDTGWFEANGITLGDDGTILLVDGLATWRESTLDISTSTQPSSSLFHSVYRRLKTSYAFVRRRKSLPTPVPRLPMPRGIRILRLNNNDIGDEGLYALFQYATEDVMLEELYLERNGFHLLNTEALPQVITFLNQSWLTTLRLSYNELFPSSVTQLFNLLDAPWLHTLELDECFILAECVPAIAAFLASPRARSLDTLDLRRNELGKGSIRMLLNTIQSSNFCLTIVLVLPYLGRDDLCYRADPELLDLRHQAQWIRKRNRELTGRMRLAAVRAMVPTRIILHAARPSADSTSSSKRWSSAPPFKALRGSTRQEEPSFRLLDLPREIQLMIARHCSGDADALSVVDMDTE
ncbi:hypothetical protein Q8F55_005803 [Vanrija albida]|uniref:F-box domain-containing protein n=1 Tax=Vanrija albida TaxID=181172 RepID=A0ABR3Q2L3_9TREE